MSKNETIPNSELEINTEKISLLAKDLSKDFPSSPRKLLGGYVLGYRTLDKCRAELNDSLGEYHFNCPLDNFFFEFTGINANEFKTFVATGVTDDEVIAWVKERSKVTDSKKILTWNNKLRDTRISDLPIELQEYMEDYIPKYIPRNRPIYVLFDVYDIEEQRI